MKSIKVFWCYNYCNFQSFFVFRSSFNHTCTLIKSKRNWCWQTTTVDSYRILTNSYLYFFLSISVFNSCFIGCSNLIERFSHFVSIYPFFFRICGSRLCDDFLCILIAKFTFHTNRIIFVFTFFPLSSDRLLSSLLVLACETIYAVWNGNLY